VLAFMLADFEDRKRCSVREAGGGFGFGFETLHQIFLASVPALMSLSATRRLRLTWRP